MNQHCYCHNKYHTKQFNTNILEDFIGGLKIAWANIQYLFFHRNGGCVYCFRGSDILSYLGQIVGAATLNAMVH